MTENSDLPSDLVEEEILSRLPITSLGAIRSTCKRWNDLTKKQIFGKKASAASKQFLGFMLMDNRVCSLSFNLQGIKEEFVDPVIKHVSIFNQIEVCGVCHCDGLLLCVVKDNKGLVVWNPYLGQTRWIQPRENFHDYDVYALGYDKNRNHKILRIFFDNNDVLGYEIYDLSSDSWKLVYVTDLYWNIWNKKPGVSLKGNAYFLSEDQVGDMGCILLCFDFTAETFVHLPLPHSKDRASLSCVRDEKLAVLYQVWVSKVVEIWVTEKIDHSFASWTMFFKLPIFNPPSLIYSAATFFIDEEAKVAVIFDIHEPERKLTCAYQTASIVGQDGYFKSVNIGEAPDLEEPDEPGYIAPIYCYPFVCPSYVPSLVQL